MSHRRRSLRDLHTYLARRTDIPSREIVSGETPARALVIGAGWRRTASRWATDTVLYLLPAPRLRGCAARAIPEGGARSARQRGFHRHRDAHRYRLGG